jgi:hypothetical protein
MNMIRILKSLKWYEYAMGACGAAIFWLGYKAWQWGPHTVEWAVQVAEPLFLAVGALSIILLWAQMRAANAQERETGLWKRVLTFHEHFDRVPSEPRADALRRYFIELGIADPPTAYHPIDNSVVAKIMGDQGTATRPTPGRTIVIEYLNDFERFCGAIRVGVVNNDYACELRGTRVIDTFFGFKSFILEYRRRMDAAALARANPTHMTVFKSRVFRELEKIGESWLERRTTEENQHRKRILDADNKGGVPDMLGKSGI